MRRFKAPQWSKHWWYRRFYVDRLMGLKLADGRRIVAINNSHFYKRVKRRRGNPLVIIFALTHPTYMVKDSYNNVKYVSLDATVIVDKTGTLKTFWYNDSRYRWAIHQGYRGECNLKDFCRCHNKRASL